ncbi:MAG TPA: signal recognition particle protein [Alphaproteobacteria bacterium]|nr:signal recognition particle protein [Alphaproteobacteria bacterium]
MFESLTKRLGDVFDKLKRRGALSEADVDAALREVRVALLEADVALPVVKDFVAQVKLRAIGQEVVRSITPGQMVVKIVHDHLVETLGSTAADINLRATPPVAVLMVGLQGSGKTTTTAKLAKRLAERDRKKVLMASLDTRRPAAQEQLAVLGQQTSTPTLPIVAGQGPVEIARRAMDVGAKEGYDVVLLDTAGRLAIDDELMAEAASVRDAVQPAETLLVADAMTGQDAVNLARSFNEKIGISGIVLTRVDGDARGGAALSMRAVTGRPIKLIGLGEKLDALDVFHPDRIAGRILGMGDIVGLVEKAAETVEREEAEKLARKVQKGEFDFDDMATQLRQLRKMGGLSSVMGLLPGIGKMQKQIADAKIDDRMVRKQEAIISSMTAKERRYPKLLNASRKRRIASGSGTTVEEVNRLIKQHLEMSRMMKQVTKLGQRGIARAGINSLFRR